MRWLGAITVAYVSLYFLLLNPIQSNFIASLGWAHYQRVASYRLGGAHAQALFAPIEWIDKKLRPEYWDVHEIVPCDESTIVAH